MKGGGRAARWWIGSVAVIVGIVVATGVLPEIPRARRAARPKPPNIVFVLTDDLATQDLARMRETVDLIGRRGTRFERHLVNVPLCCPSRVTTLRGQYAHNTGILTNHDYDAFSRGFEQDTIATRLQLAGYRTGLFGKYLNGYASLSELHDVPPGWDEWASPVFGDEYGQYNYVLNKNGVPRVHGSRPSDYGTHVYTRLAEEFITRSARREQPFFLFLSLYAPHVPATPAPRDEGSFPDAHAPRTPGFDQHLVYGMPAYVRDLPRLSQPEIRAIDRLAQLRRQSLQSVDRGVASLVATLRRTGQLERTYVVFTSDNGFHLGQHRLPAGKQTPYDTDVRVPLLVRGPGVVVNHVHQLTGNVDLAPTFATMAGIRPPPFTDGRSLLPLLRTRRSTGPWRRAYLVEHGRASGQCPPGQVACAGVPPGAGADPGRQVPADAPWRDYPSILDRRPAIPKYSAIRTQRYLYVEYGSGERELYDLRADPDETRNLAGQRPRVELLLAQHLRRLKRCQATSCRRVERTVVP